MLIDGKDLFSYTVKCVEMSLENSKLHWGGGLPCRLRYCMFYDMK